MIDLPVNLVNAIPSILQFIQKIECGGPAKVIVG
jgi:hypothetical protein